MMLYILIIAIFACLSVTHATFHVASTFTEGIPEHNSTPFTKIGENYYFIESKKQINWFGAANACRKMNSNLASIETPEEAEALYAHLKTLQNVPLPWLFWLSGHDLESEGDYKWLGTGKSLSFTNWAAWQPSGGGEHCIQIWRVCNETWIKNGKLSPHNFWDCHLPECDFSKCWNINWNDAGCSSRANYICEASRPMTASITIWS